MMCDVCFGDTRNDATPAISKWLLNDHSDEQTTTTPNNHPPHTPNTHNTTLTPVLSDIEYNLSSHPRNPKTVVSASPTRFPDTSTNASTLFSDLPPSTSPYDPTYLPKSSSSKPSKMYDKQVEYVLHHPNHVLFEGAFKELEGMTRAEVEEKVSIKAGATYRPCYLPSLLQT
jgi:hypothetical protein